MTGGRPAAAPVLSAATEVVGVIGDPVAHSLSPRLHNAAFAALGLDWVSVGFEVPAGHTGTALAGAAALGLRGLSVTMPHKEAAARVVDRLGQEAADLDAVNCVVFEERRMVGENTDGAGLVDALRRGGHFEPEGRRCAVIGAGGAGRAAVAGLSGAGAAEVIVVNRTRARAEAAAALAGAAGRTAGAEDAAGCDLVVNATPLGMGARSGNDQPWPIDPGLLHPGQLVVDLVYHPRRTPWLAAAEEMGATVQNGVGMLVHQAALQITRWTGREAPVGAMWAAVLDDEGDAAT